MSRPAVTGDPSPGTPEHHDEQIDRAIHEINSVLHLAKPVETADNPYLPSPEDESIDSLLRVDARGAVTLSRTQKRMSSQSLPGTNRVAATLSGNPQSEHVHPFGARPARYFLSCGVSIYPTGSPCEIRSKSSQLHPTVKFSTALGRSCAGMLEEQIFASGLSGFLSAVVPDRLDSSYGNGECASTLYFET